MMSDMFIYMRMQTLKPLFEKKTHIPRCNLLNYTYQTSIVDYTQSIPTAELWDRLETYALTKTNLDDDLQ